MMKTKEEKKRKKKKSVDVDTLVRIMKYYEAA